MVVSDLIEVKFCTVIVFFLLCFFTQALLLRSFTHIIPLIYIMQFVEERCGISFLCHLTSDFNLADNKTDKT